jgi:RNA polymerase sigma-70 factor (ECF subfamily)
MDTTARQEQLFSRCATELRPMFWRISGAYAAAAEREDLVQEILLAIWRKLPGFEGRAKLSTWAWQVAFYTALNWNRRQRRRPATEAIDDGPEPAAAPPGPAAARLEAVYAALKHLPEGDRSLLLMALEDLSRAEMAAVLGVSENAVQVRLHRARKRLNATLKEMES